MRLEISYSAKAKLWLHLTIIAIETAGQDTKHRVRKVSVKLVFGN